MRLALKTASDDESLIWSSSLFQSLDAATEKKFSNIENVKKFEKNSNIDQEEITFIAQIRPYQPCVRARE